METDKKATTQWGKAAIGYQNYQDYLALKNDKFKLKLVDLLYVSNFKGGNATINEYEHSVEQKLTYYSTILKEISSNYGSKSLGDLCHDERVQLKKLITRLCELTKKDCPTKIDGFGASYLSALMSSFFPKLIPILDRRILLNLKLVREDDVSSQGQIKNIEKFYPILIDKMYSICTKSNKSLREIDKEIFIMKLINVTEKK